MKVCIKYQWHFVMLIFILLTGTACSSKSSCTQKRTMNDIEYSVSCISNENIKEQYNVDSTLQFANLSRFIFTITSTESNNEFKSWFQPKRHNDLLFYVNNEIANDLNIFIGQDIYKPVLVHFESSNKISNKLTFLVAFEPLKTNITNFTFEYNDHLFNNGKIKFNYNTQALI